MEVIGYIIIALVVVIMGGGATYPLWKKDLDAINAGENPDEKKKKK